MKMLTACLAAGLVAVAATATLAGQNGNAGGNLVVYGDVAYFLGPGRPLNCTLNNRFKRGDPVGFRATAIDPGTGKRDKATKLVVHLSYGGRTIDIPMRDRQTVKEPEREFWVAKWMVPQDAALGIVRYTITATDPQGRTGEFKPFEVQASQITIVE